MNRKEYLELRATMLADAQKLIDISIHALVWRATSFLHNDVRIEFYFNPCSRMESDMQLNYFHHKQVYAQYIESHKPVELQYIKL